MEQDRESEIDLAVYREQIFDNWAEYLNKHLTEEDIWMANKHMKRCSISSLVIRGMKIKTPERYCYTSIKMAKMKTTDHIRCWSGCGGTGTFVHCWQECKKIGQLWKTLWRVLQSLYS